MRRPGRRDLRLYSGLILFVYVSAHLVNPIAPVGYAQTSVLTIAGAGWKTVRAARHAWRGQETIGQQTSRGGQDDSAEPGMLVSEQFLAALGESKALQSGESVSPVDGTGATVVTIDEHIRTVRFRLLSASEAARHID